MVGLVVMGLNYKRVSLVTMAVKHCTRLPREVVGTPYLKTFNVKLEQQVTLKAS